MMYQLCEETVNSTESTLPKPVSCAFPLIPFELRLAISPTGMIIEL